MNKTAPLFLLLATLSACGPVKESFVDVCTGEKIAGYDKTCKWRIGKTRRRDFSTDEAERLKAQMGFVFSLRDNRESLTNRLLAVFGNSGVATTLGIQVGDPLHKVETMYGKAYCCSIELVSVPGSSEQEVLNGLFYKDKNLYFVADESNREVHFMMIGILPLSSLPLLRRTGD